MVPKTKSENSSEIAVVANDIIHIKNDISEIKEMLRDSFVTLREFKPVRAVAYGLVGTICLAVIGALIALIVP